MIDRQQRARAHAKEKGPSMCIEAERQGCSSIESTAFYSVIILLQLDDKLRVVPSRNFSRAWVRDRMFIK